MKRKEKIVEKFAVKKLYNLFNILVFIQTFLPIGMNAGWRMIILLDLHFAQGLNIL